MLFFVWDGATLGDRILVPDDLPVYPLNGPAIEAEIEARQKIGMELCAVDPEGKVVDVTVLPGIRVVDEFGLNQLPIH